MSGPDHTGKTFGFLTAVERVQSRTRGKRRDAIWRCICVCGNYKDVLAAHLISYQCKSCGCGQYKLTPKQREELLLSYLSKGYQASKPLAEAYGVAPRYMARMARRFGYTNNKQGKFKEEIPRNKYQDPRWRWAVERGALVR